MIKMKEDGIDEKCNWLKVKLVGCEGR